MNNGEFEMRILSQTLRLNLLKDSPTAAKATEANKLGEVAHPSYGATRSNTAQHTAALVGTRSVRSTTAEEQPKKAAAPKTEEAPKKSFSERMGKHASKSGSFIWNVHKFDPTLFIYQVQLVCCLHFT